MLGRVPCMMKGMSGFAGPWQRLRRRDYLGSSDDGSEACMCVPMASWRRASARHCMPVFGQDQPGPAAAAAAAPMRGMGRRRPARKDRGKIKKKMEEVVSEKVASAGTPIQRVPGEVLPATSTSPLFTI